MWVIGLRRKYFIISFLVLIVTTLSVAGVLLTYFRQERLVFLDNQIRQSATSIIESKLSELKTYDDEEADEIISEELGPNRLGKFFIVRSKNGDVLFETQNISLLELDIPQDPQWLTIQTPKHFIRVLNLKLPRFQTRTLQVGIVVDASFISLTHLNDRTLAAIAVILLVVLSLTWLLSAYLFSPIRKLSTHLHLITKSLENNTQLPSFPARHESRDRRWGMEKHDEFYGLVNAINGMVEKINTNKKFMKSWTFQMAHELKTPLTILNRDFEIIAETYKVDKAAVKDVEKNVEKISQTITSFLDWAQLTSLRSPGQLYVTNLQENLEPILMDLKKIYGDRLRIGQQENFQILANPLHLEQLLSNIISNALKYSEEDIQVSYASGTLTVQDKGPGIPSEVLEKMGSPFNKGLQNSISKKGIGLGLAWIKTICDLYGWSYRFENVSGTTVSIVFPPLDSSS